MNNSERLKLRFGPYQVPIFELGAMVQCEVRGLVQIVGVSDGRIQWRLGKPKGKRGNPSLIVYHDLAKAVRNEANIVIQHWWSVGPSTVQKWRKVLERVLKLPE